MIGFDFDRTIFWLEDLNYPFPDKGVVLSGRPSGKRHEVLMKIRKMGLPYDVYTQGSGVGSYSRDQAAVFKAQSIITLHIDKYYDDSEYQLNIIHNFIRPYVCQLKQVTKSGVADFPRKNLINL